MNHGRVKIPTKRYAFKCMIEYCKVWHVSGLSNNLDLKKKFNTDQTGNEVFCVAAISSSDKEGTNRNYILPFVNCMLIYYGYINFHLLQFQKKESSWYISICA